MKSRSQQPRNRDPNRFNLRRNAVALSWRGERQRCSLAFAVHSVLEALGSEVERPRHKGSTEVEEDVEHKQNRQFDHHVPI